MFVPRLMVKLFTVCAVEAIEENAIVKTAAARIIIFRIFIIIYLYINILSVPVLLILITEGLLMWHYYMSGVTRNLRLTSAITANEF